MRRIYAALLITILGFFWPTTVTAQSEFGSFEYVSPRPNAILVNAGTTIAVRQGDEIEVSTMSTDLFTVVGSLSGVHTGIVILADDNKTVIFKPDAPFTPEEVVSVTINAGLATAPDGTMIEDAFAYDFTVSPLTSDQASTLHRTRLANALAVHDQQYDIADNDTPNADISAASALMSAVPYTDTTSYATIPATFPHISVTVPADGADNGYIFTANLTRRSAFPYLLMYENSGDPVYYQEMEEGVRFRDFRVQPNGMLTYFNQPDFVYLAMDNSYRIVASYGTGNGYQTDFHGLQLNEAGHALMQIYDDQPIDMSQIVDGGLVTATVTGAIVQELDPSGNVIFEWRSWDHFDILDASDRIDFTSDDVDVTHINSADWDSDGNIIMSNRNMDEITKVSRASANVIWRFGGKKNQFTLTNAAEDGVEFFNWQHDARRQATGTLTLFDNGNHKDPPRSRAVEFELDEENLTATQVWQYRNEPDFFGFATGNVQRLPNGNSLIDWGGVGVNEHLPFITEVKPDGTKAYEAYFVENESSYRTFRYPWEGRPFEPPMLVASSIGAATRLHYSWNGATNVASYDIYAGKTTNPTDLTKVASQTKDGFETVSDLTGVDESCYFYSVVPVDQAGADGTPSNLVFAGDDSCALVATVTANAATEATLDAPETAGSVVVNAPTGVVSDTVTLVLNDIPAPTQPLPTDINLVMAFSLEAQRNGLVLPDFDFSAPISLTVNYAEAAIARVDESTLEVRFWHPGQQAWIADGIEITGQDAGNNQVAFTTDNLKNFAIFARLAAPTALEQIAEPTELLSDGSFEMTPGESSWTYWTESDGDNAAPFSCATHSCGYDSVQSRDGERLVYLGFYSNAEQTRLSQSFEAPTMADGDSANLSLWIMRDSVEGSVPFAGNNSLKVYIDDTELISVTDLDLQERRYLELSADVTAHLTGTHTFRIDGVFEADSGAFYIDAVSLQVVQPIDNKMYLPFIGIQ